MSNKTPKQGAGKGSTPNQGRQSQMANMSSQNLKDNTDYVLLDKDLIRGLSEKEVEIEHLKTTIVALSNKIEVSIYINRLIIHLFSGIE
jgi:hypothetical protein